MNHDTATLAQQLIDRIGTYDQVVVAFSGGVDSSVVAAAAYRSLGERSLAMTAISPSVARWQREAAETVAKQIGIQHQWIETDEIESADYRRNDSQRCFYCKQTLYQSVRQAIGRVAESTSSIATLLSGTNADDLTDYRPGLKAGHDASVATPLADLGMTKADVRRVAKFFQLPNDQTPASPCLSSRIAYGIEVTRQRLDRIDAGEAWLRQRGFDDVRVRLLPDQQASVEVPLADLPKLRLIDHELTCWLLSLGFAKVTIDSRGLRSGNLNLALTQIKPRPVSVSASGTSSNGNDARGIAP